MIEKVSTTVPRWFETIQGNNQIAMEQSGHILVFAFADWGDEPIPHDNDDEEGKRSENGICILRIKVARNSTV